MKRAGLWTACWGVLFGAWLLYNGQSDDAELVAAACSALIAVTAAAVVDRCAWRKLRFRALHLARVPRPVWAIFPQFAYVTAALWGRPHGRFVDDDAGGRAGSESPTGRAERVFLTYLDALSPNDYTIEVDRERKLAARHTLVPKRLDPLP